MQCVVTLATRLSKSLAYEDDLTKRGSGHWNDEST